MHLRHSTKRPFFAAQANQRHIIFVATNMTWGGSEELWTGAALDLFRNGLPIGVSVHGYQPQGRNIVKLSELGVQVQIRTYPLVKRVWRKVFAMHRAPLEIEVSSLLRANPPALVIVSGDAEVPIEFLERCVVKNVPFATICQANTEYFWPDDKMAGRYRKVMSAAQRCYFVSRANRELFERQIGCELSNTEIVRNPYNVRIDAAPNWPPFNANSTLRFACVGRLDPPSKGQDILLEAFASNVWKKRDWALTFYGTGPAGDILGRLARRFELSDRVKFAGFVDDVEEIWTENHLLVMPSRYEGLPLAIVEAMICGRTVVATAVAGNSEIIEDGVTGFLADAPTVSSVGNALERMWSRRFELEKFGAAAALSIRQQVPSDPAKIFAEKIKSLVGLG
jgi:glycosyltransferase involved in cell wall biosynthesis